jgi:hypothetical protein
MKAESNRRRKHQQKAITAKEKENGVAMAKAKTSIIISVGMKSGINSVMAKAINNEK